MKKFKMENKYLVLKWDDISQHLTDPEREQLDNIMDSVAIGRMGQRKKDNTYVVVNEDEPYAEQVWQLIQEYWEKNEIPY